MLPGLKVVRRAGWGLGDQALSSLTNFALGAVVARSVSPESFGAFTLAFATYLLILGVSRAVSSEPFVIRFSAVSDREWKRGVASSTGTSILVGIVGGIGCAVAGLLSGGNVRGSFLALALTLPGLMLQDNWRNVFFARRSGSQAFVNDLVWAIALFPAIGVAIALDLRSGFWLMMCWGVSGSLAGLFGLLQSRVVPKPLNLLAWWREQRDLIPSLVGEIATLTGARQLTVYGVGAIAGLTAVASIRAGLLLLGPLNILVMGTRIMAVPEAVRALKQSKKRLVQGVVLMCSGLSGVTLLWGAAMLFLPRSIGTQILGDNWEGARNVLVPLILADAIHGASMGTMVGLRALAAAKQSFRAKLVMSGLQIAGGLGGAIAGGALGSSWGRAIASGLGAVFYWGFFKRALDNYVATPAADDGEGKGSTSSSPAATTGPRVLKPLLEGTTSERT